MAKKCCKTVKKEEFNDKSGCCSQHTQEKADAGKCCKQAKKPKKPDPKKGCCR
ncbi:MAG: hypothetical protein KUG81_07660 [Gammaproteobacteria bacterium]|nr:hypothetical protein [Gammaproteobacteria bacterium]